MQDETPPTAPAEEQQIQPDAPTTETVGDGPDAPVIPDAAPDSGLLDAPPAGGDIYSTPSSAYDPSPGDVAAARGVDAPAEHDGHTIDLGAPSQVVDEADEGALAAAEEVSDAEDFELEEDPDEESDDLPDPNQTATVEGEPGVDFPGTAKTI